MRCTKSPTSGRRVNHRGGFTMVELLITVGIIITIASIALPVILMAKRKGTEARVKSDLALIGNAIAAYRGDFQDIPRFADPVSDLAADNAGTQGGGNLWLDYSSDRGARLLCFALVGPGDSGKNALANPGEDGADGPGFRIRRNMAGGAGPVQGRIFGPYVQIGAFKIEYDTTNQYPMADAKLLDVNGNPILYYPALPGIAVTSVNGGYVTSADPRQYSTGSPKPLYNAFDNTVDTTPSAGGRTFISQSDMQKMMNADPNTGAVLVGTQATYTGPYILWTAGLDGKYGLDPAGKTDDIANFDWPAQMRR